MTPNRSVILSAGLCGVVLAAAICVAGADDDRKPPAASERDRWMAAKLTSAQQIIEHLTSGDFKSLQESARRMQVMNFLEQWQREEDFEEKSEYQGQLNAFEFATKELIRHSGDRNVNGALDAYTAMTRSCVRCHSLIRDADRN